VLATPKDKDPCLLVLSMPSMNVSSGIKQGRNTTSKVILMQGFIISALLQGNVRDIILGNKNVRLALYGVVSQLRIPNISICRKGAETSLRILTT